MLAQLREKATRLRTEKELSYSEIKKRLGVPKSTLSYWLRDFPLSEKRLLELRRKGWKKGEAARERFRNTMRQKREKKFSKIYRKQKSLMRSMKNKKDISYIAGLMLYLGEGNKKDNYIISISNTDPNLQRFFIRWSAEYLEISKEKLKAQLHLYENMDIEKEQKFWQNILGLKRSQFYKTQIRKFREGSFSYRESFRHGTCQVRFDSGEKKMKLMAALRAFVDSYVA